jgi:hypothetical protein
MNHLIDSLFEKLPPLRKNLMKEFDRLFGPQINHPYFCKRPGVPYDFQYDADSYGIVNAAWMADAALLAYVPNRLDNLKNFNLDSLDRAGWNRNYVKEELAQAGFPGVKFFNRKGTQLFVAHNSKAVVVSFRGTEVKELRDLLYDGKFTTSNEGTGKIHGGFQAGVDAVWKSKGGQEGLVAYLRRVTKNGSIPIWFTGHSLGAALAIIAAKRWNAAHKVQGLYTFGSPGVGNKGFTHLFRNMHAVRFVHNLDIVTTVSQEPNFLHVGDLYIVNAQRKIVENTKRALDREKIFPKLPKYLLEQSLKSLNVFANTGNPLELPRWLADHAPKFYSNYIRRNV